MVVWSIIKNCLFYKEVFGNLLSAVKNKTAPMRDVSCSQSGRRCPFCSRWLTLLRRSDHVFIVESV